MLGIYLMRALNARQTGCIQHQNQHQDWAKIEPCFGPWILVNLSHGSGPILGWFQGSRSRGPAGLGMGMARGVENSAWLETERAGRGKVSGTRARLKSATLRHEGGLPWPRPKIIYNYMHAVPPVHTRSLPSHIPSRASFSGSHLERPRIQKESLISPPWRWSLPASHCLGIA